MKCQNCPTKNFVHANLYCQDCKGRKTVTGTAYLYRKNKLLPLESVEIESTEGEEFLVAAHELLQQFKMEFVPDEN